MGSGRSQSTTVLAESAAMIALASVLFMVKVFVFPEGGEVTLGSMVPILLLALRRGVRVGVVAGVVFGLIVLYLEPFIAYPAQVLLDYPLAYGSLGLAGLMKGRGTAGAVAGAGIGIGSRFVCHFVSGVLFFASYAPVGESAYLYSAIYNASYLVPELVISASAIIVLAQRGLLDVKVRQAQPPLA